MVASRRPSANCAAARTTMTLMTFRERVQKRKRFILVDREHGNVLGDTGFDWNGQPVPRISGLSPVRAAAMLQGRGATDQYPYRYRHGQTQPSERGVRRLPRTAGFPTRAEGSPPDAVACASANASPRSPASTRIARSVGGRWHPPSMASIAHGSMATPSAGTTPTDAAARAATSTASCPRASRPRVLRRTRSTPRHRSARGTFSPTCTAAAGGRISSTLGARLSCRLSSRQHVPRDAAHHGCVLVVRQVGRRDPATAFW